MGKLQNVPGVDKKRSVPIFDSDASLKCASWPREELKRQTLNDRDNRYVCDI